MPATLSRYIISIIFLIAWSGSLKAAEDLGAQRGGADTFYVQGANDMPLSAYASYWVDSGGKADVWQAERAFRNGYYRRWGPDARLHAGYCPYPLWIRMTVRHTGRERQTYWWSFYTHADSIWIFRKNAPADWVATDTLSHHIPAALRKIPARFQASQVSMAPDETAALMARTINKRRTIHTFTDFTTPVSNLLWEKDFYWTTGVFIGCFLVIAIVSLGAGVFARARIFMLFGLYILLVAGILISEELLGPLLPPVIFSLFNRLHPLPLLIIAQGMHFRMIRYVFTTAQYPRWLGTLDRINLAGTVTGVVLLFLYVIFRDGLHYGQPVYLAVWKLSLLLIVFMNACMVAAVLLSLKRTVRITLGILAGVMLLYFNPAGYYLNYAGVWAYYPITYPGYFYWGLILECTALGCFIAWRYRKMIQENTQLRKARQMQESGMRLHLLEMQDRQRQEIARDLHDDLGATLSAIRLVMTNSYREDAHLISMITKANEDLRHYLSNLTGSGLTDNSLIHTIQKKVQGLNRLGQVQFSFIPAGTEESVPLPVALEVSYIINELMSNILKHAEASEAVIQLVIEGAKLLLITEDNGRGYETSGQHLSGMGLDNILHRTKSLGGTMHVSSNSHGTTTIIQIPF